jgi:outer membrane cobalamin receptor
MKVLIALLFLSISAYGQSVVSGKVTDEKNNPIAGANVFLEGTYDGATTAEDGTFSFSTTATAKQILVASFLTYETSKVAVHVKSAQNLVVVLRENVNALDAVIVTAGTFEAGDKARVSVLKPLDIVTTAGSAGDIVAALQTLPGTQTVGEDGRLFVRGGEADEAQTFIDGIRVAQPYGAKTSELPTRGRFSPFLFNGISFSTGGYSAEYGEALSSVLLLNTVDEPDQEKTDVSLMTVGLGLGHTKKWGKRSLSFNAAYIDLAPYQVAIPQDVKWHRPFQSLSGESVFRHRFEKGLLKFYAAFDASRFDFDQIGINAPYTTRIDLNNNNFYANASYKGDLADDWKLATGISYGYNKVDTGLNLDAYASREHAAHAKAKIQHDLSYRVKISVGADYFATRYRERFDAFGTEDFAVGFDSQIVAAFTEADIRFSKKFAIKAGLRATYNELLEENCLSPRLSLAYKINKGQFSLAYGDFSQAPKADYLRYSDFHRFDNEKASHYILNYQYSKERLTFRAEAYYKGYRDLVRFSGENETAVFSNDGDGFAKGIDVFWRDGRTVKNLEYWISYSFIDTERKYRDFPGHATPGFVANHSLSVVTKWWISSWRSQLGLTNTFTTGRPFDNPNEAAFMNGRTRGYNSLSLGWAYLMTQQKILYFSVSNVLGNQNVFGYEYASAPNEAGHFDRREIKPTADRFFFVGFFWTVSDDKTSNQLDNL